MKFKKYRGKGEQIKNKAPKLPCYCKLKCFVLFPENIRTRIYAEFGQLAKYDLQNSYLFACIRHNAIKAKTKK